LRAIPVAECYENSSDWSDLSRGCRQPAPRRDDLLGSFHLPSEDFAEMIGTAAGRPEGAPLLTKGGRGKLSAGTSSAARRRPGRRACRGGGRGRRAGGRGR